MWRFFSAIWHVCKWEIYRSVRTPAAWISAFLIPVLWCVVYAYAFSGGLMTKLPVGFVDLDHSQTSRALATTLDAIPSVRLVNFDNPEVAYQALQKVETYATVVVPENYELDRKRGLNTALTIDLNKVFYPAATTLELDIKTALLTDHIREAAVQTTLAHGGTFSSSLGNLRLIQPDLFLKGNIAFNYVAYLLPTMIPGVLALGAVLCFVSVLVREWREGQIRKLMKFARGSRMAAFIGQVLPWFVLYAIAGVVWVVGFAGVMGWGVAGHLWLWIAAIWLLIMSMATFAICMVSLSPTWVIAVAGVICLTAPTFPFTGFSFPSDAMSMGARLFGDFLPLTHFLHAQAQVWVLDSPLDHTLKSLGFIGGFMVVTTLIAYGFLGLRIPKWKAHERQLRRLRQLVATANWARPQPLAGFTKTFFETMRASILNRNSFVILALAIAFYLVFYSWPYSNQQIEDVPVGVVNLDGGPVAKHFIEALEATPATHIAFITPNPAEGMDAFKREKVDVLVTVPTDLSGRLSRGENGAIHILGNGGYPVKARAIQAAIAGIITDDQRFVDGVSYLTPGVTPTQLAATKTAGPSTVVNYHFNNISGYGNYTVPMVGPIIIQSVMLMGITMALGGWFAGRVRPTIIEDALRWPVRRGLAVFLAYWVIGYVWFLYMESVDFRWAEFPTMNNPEGAILAGAIYTAAVSAFGLAITTIFGSNAWTTPMIVVMSSPSLFVSGGVWPQELITNPLVAAVRQFLPSTPGVELIIGTSQDGAPITSFMGHIVHLACLTLLYLLIAWLTSRRLVRGRGPIVTSRTHAFSIKDGH